MVLDEQQKWQRSIFELCCLVYSKVWSNQKTAIVDYTCRSIQLQDVWPKPDIMLFLKIIRVVLVYNKKDTENQRYSVVLLVNFAVKT